MSHNRDLFVAFIALKDGEYIDGNIVIPHRGCIRVTDDITALQEYIEMTVGLGDVLITNYRRME